jgi:hypothetical protein
MMVRPLLFNPGIRLVASGPLKTQSCQYILYLHGAKGIGVGEHGVFLGCWGSDVRYLQRA